ncbi:hypothetical protein [Pseudorhodoferax sp.]|uniref:hypothetical protein n=1 Tax=Pseudorhodoferax sp. TaxID=1993553 RepID=UPI002DD627A2|nr:hypothetical protein [Pseudorhodoferax sp.]
MNPPNPPAPAAGHLSSRHWRLLLWGTAAAALLLPLVAMGFSDEVRWSVADFAVFGLMLTVVGGLGEAAVRLTANRAYRAAAALALAGGFLLLWANGAVGLIGSETQPVNRLFVLVPAVAVFGAVIARFKAGGMAWALAATAAAQALLAVVALAVFGAGGLEVLLVTALFGGLWLLSAALFRRAARSVVS